MADVVERTDLRMIQVRDGFRFALEALLANRIRGKLRGKNLDSDSAFQPCIASAVDFTHPAGTERASNFVRAKMSAWSQGHNWRRLYSRKSLARVSSTANGSADAEGERLNEAGETRSQKLEIVWDCHSGQSR